MLEERIAAYRKGQADCTQPVGAFRNDQAATFTMVHCADTNEKARAVAEESFVWYPKTAAAHIGSLAEYMASGGQDLGNYSYAAEALAGSKSGLFDHLNMDYIYDSGAAVVGDPDRCIEIAKRYEAVGCELLFCLLNPYKIPHEEVMHSIELLGKHVIPEFAD
jgi:alkanesulfonate monooxygenase SsuD/methylene tetrahydromethanopterin reductase-like flavin-dependent oxidoreductase (luciferase family)